MGNSRYRERIGVGYNCVQDSGGCDGDGFHGGVTAMTMMVVTLVLVAVVEGKLSLCIRAGRFSAFIFVNQRILAIFAGFSTGQAPEAGPVKHKILLNN